MTDLKDIIEKALNNKWNKKNITFNPNVGLGDMIFAPDFLRAYFHLSMDSINKRIKEEQEMGEISEEDKLEIQENYWKNKAKELVLSEDRIKYLKSFL